jgi:hypothetical protein
MKIVEEFLKKGYFLDNNVLNTFSEHELTFVLEKIEKSPEPKKLTTEEIKKLLESEKFRITNFRKKGEFSVYDFGKILVERYNYFFKILSKKTFLPIFSISSANKTKKYAIIGFVFEIKNDEIVVEDLTGTTSLNNTKKFKIWKDCCCLFVCEGENIEEIFYPELGYKEFNSSIFIGSELKTNIPSIIFSNKTSSEKNVLFINFEEQDFFQIKFGNETILLIDSSKIDFEKERTFKTRLLVTEAEKIVRFGSDIYLIKEEPSLIILANSDETKIIDRAPLTIKIKEKENLLINKNEIKRL